MEESQVKYPRVVLSSEEERRLCEIDEKVYGCPWYYHDEEDHVSHMLRVLWIDDEFQELLDEEGLTDEDREFLRGVREKVEKWWWEYVEYFPEDFDFTLMTTYGWGWKEMDVMYPDGEIRSTYFSKTGDGWTIFVSDRDSDEDVELVEFAWRFGEGKREEEE